MLEILAAELKEAIRVKRDIQGVGRQLGQVAGAGIRLGDDCAAIPDGQGYLLLAAEAMWPVLVEQEPWLAGWCSIQVNVNDIYAMGGHPIAVVDALWGESGEQIQPLLEGMAACARVYNVPIVGGHTNARSPYNALSVAILGRATRLISSFQAQDQDILLMAVDLRGKPHPRYLFWDASRGVDPEQLRGDLEVLPQLAEAGLCDCGKDISMGGVVGTLLMLLETSGCGAVVDLPQIPAPEGIPLARWLCSFPSYGFILSVRPHQVAQVQPYFAARGLTCAPIGRIQIDRQLILRLKEEELVFWDLSHTPLTGFSAHG
ncbi:sll0787 family AIR synthase-like protein [Anthocerotibacter panamensis]|uniref:sll0787 family AIR synthase-like protein n=1 Tax=Anthocerotibacter panamensis TaxID=2857077 RepID=UPI001C40287C|nr:sll0787 family AIR synthase-like protein [Anthocerotibacter panamensis]